MGAFHWSPVPVTWIDWTQLVGWVALAAALPLFLTPTVVELLRPARRIRAAGLAALALAARLAASRLPVNWYSPVSNVTLGANIYTNQTAYMPLPNQLFTFGWGFGGIVAFNIAIGVASVLMLWLAAEESGYGARVSAVFGILLAVVPLYVRLSSSDATHLLPLGLWSLAALALIPIVAGRGRAVDHVVLCLVTALVCPVRLEAGLAAPTVLFFVGRSPAGWQAMWAARRRLLALGAGIAIGAITSVPYYAGTWSSKLLGHRFVDRLGELIQWLVRCLFVADVSPFTGWFPFVIVLCAWIYVIACLRRHDYTEVASTVVPFAVSSIPFAFGGEGLFANLPSGGYNVVVLVFVLLPAARGIVFLADGIRAGTILRTRWRRAAAAVVAAASLVPGALAYRRTYAYMEEFGFLQQALPREPATLLAIFDPTCPDGGYDCCLALPYPTFVGDFPRLRWVILTQEDIRAGRLDHLDFDYFYPGTLTQLDVDHLNDWFVGRLFPDPEVTARQQAPLRALQSIEAAVRARYPMDPWSSATVPAYTSSFAGFRDDRVTLTIFKRRPAPGP